MLERILNLPLLPWSFTRRVVGWYMRVRDRHLTSEGRYVFAAGLFTALTALDVAGTRVYLVWCAFFGMFAASLGVKFWWRFPVTLRRSIPAVATVGEPLSYRIFVTNEGTRPLRELHVREDWLPRGVRHVHHRGVVALVDEVEPGATAAARLGVRFERRGVYTLGATRVERFCPFGLMRAGVSQEGADQVVVHPVHYNVGRVRLSSADVHQPGGIPMASSVGESTEFVGLREYRPGDQVKHISWKAWARLGEPAVLEFQSEYYRRVALVLDTGVTGRSGALADFEAAVSACASLARHFEEGEYVVDLFAAGPDLYYLQAGRGLARLADVLEVLSLVEPSRSEQLFRVETPLRPLLAGLSALVIVTTDWLPRHRSFVAGLEGLVRQIKPVVVTSARPASDPGADLREPGLAAVLDARRLEEELVEL